MKYFSNDMGCVGIAIMLALLAIFPPLALVFIIVYALIADNIGFNELISKIVYVLFILAIIFIIFFPPIAMLVSFFKIGIIQTFHKKTSWILYCIGETCILFILNKLFSSNNKASKKRKQPLYKSISTHSSNHKSIYPPVQENNFQNDAIPNEKEAEKNTSKTVTKVYVTKSGKKYHQKNCDSIKHYLTSEIDLDTAKKQGYSPCHICCKNNY